MSKGKQKDKLSHYTDNMYKINDTNRWFRVSIDSIDGTYNKTYIPYLAKNMSVIQWKNIKKALFNMIDQINDEFNIGMDEEY